MDSTSTHSDLANASATRLQDQCDDLRALADDLRQAADRLSYRAYDLQQAAFNQRKRSAELSGHWSKRSVVDESTSSIEDDIAQAAELELHGKQIRRHLRIVLEVYDKQKGSDLVEGTKKLVGNTASAARASKVQDRFASRLSSRFLEGNLDGQQAATSHLRKVSRDLYSSGSLELGSKMAGTRCADSTWTSIDGHNCEEKAKVGIPNLRMDKATAFGLMQYTYRQDWNQRRLMLRKANRLRRVRIDEDSE